MLTKRRIGNRIRMLRKKAGLKSRDNSIGFADWRKYIADLSCNPIRQRMNYLGFGRRAFNIDLDS